MDAWAAYRRGQADTLGLLVVDTTRKSIEAVTDASQNELESLRAEAAGPRVISREYTPPLTAVR